MDEALSMQAKYPEMTLDSLADILSLTVKHDKENKLVTFLAMLSAYTDNSQINISFNAPSSSGKTYMANQIAKLFPKEDKIELSGASPTSFFYRESEEDEETGVRTVSLERKILIFYEMPNPQLQAKLRSVLSHDERELTYQITNKSKGGKNRADQIVIRGFPATVFCSANLRMDEQETTRAIILSPEVTNEKLRESIHLQAFKNANQAVFNSSIESDEKRKLLKERIIAIRDEQVDDIIVPNPEAIKNRFYGLMGVLKPRHQRDIEHLMQLIKATALFNVWHRKDGDDIVASQSDIEQAFEIWGYFMESMKLGIAPTLLNFYMNFILPAYYEKKQKELALWPIDVTEDDVQPIGISRPELNKYYLSITDNPLEDEYLRKQMLPQLENAGLIYQAKPETGDRRNTHVFPILLFDEQENNIGNNSVIEDEDTVDYEGAEQNIGQSEANKYGEIDLEQLPF